MQETSKTRAEVQIPGFLLESVIEEAGRRVGRSREGVGEAWGSLCLLNGLGTLSLPSGDNMSKVTYRRKYLVRGSLIVSEGLKPQSPPPMSHLL